MDYCFYECRNPECRFRFPAGAGELVDGRCPHCGAPTEMVAAQQRAVGQTTVPSPNALHLELLLDNIRSLYNVGALLRTADGAGVRHVHLGGITAPPTHPKLAKTALGAEQVLAWSQTRNGVATAQQLKEAGYVLWALEDAPGAEPLFEAKIRANGRPVLLIVGNEKAGVDSGLLALCDRILALPMMGHKESLNVAVACGIAIYYLRFGLVMDR